MSLWHKPSKRQKNPAQRAGFFEDWWSLQKFLRNSLLSSELSQLLQKGTFRQFNGTSSSENGVEVNPQVAFPLCCESLASNQPCRIFKLPTTVESEQIFPKTSSFFFFACPDIFFFWPSGLHGVRSIADFLRGATMRG